SIRYKAGPARGKGLGHERGYLAEIPVQFLAAGQAPGPVSHLAGAPADPEPGRVLLAVDAELDRVDPAGVLDGQLFLPLRRERVHGHAEMVTGDAAQRDVINRAVGALQ